MQKPNLILTGATGLVGSRFVELYGEMYNISNLDLTTGVDITSAASVESFIQAHPAEAIIHLAAFTDTAKAEAERGNQAGLTYQVNVLGTQNIAQAAYAHNLYLIHVSTDFVFDGTKPTPYLETDSPSPLGWYGTTKALAEEVVQNSGATTAIARLSYPYRANFTLKPDIITKLRTALETKTLPPQFNDTQITPTFVDEIALGFHTLLKKRLTGVFHLVGSTSLSPYDLALTVAQAYHLDSTLVRPTTLDEYLKNNPRPFARNGSISNTATQAKLGLIFSTLSEGLAHLTTQQAL